MYPCIFKDTLRYYNFLHDVQVEVTPSEIYGGFARNCIARTVDDDNEETVYTVTDENGCSTDPDIFRDWQYDREKGFLTATFDAFKFPDSNTIKFKCNIRVCFGQCQPQNCAGRNAFGRRRRETEHEIEGSVYTGQLREEIQVPSTSAWTKRSVKKQYIIPFDIVTRWS